MKKLGKAALRSVWMAWERGFGWISRVRSIHTTRFGICTVFIKRHAGPSIICEDATMIRKGDWVGELHLHNASVLELLQTGGADRTALKTARLARQSLEEISEAFERLPEFKQVKALIGVTLLHRGLTHGLGFEQHKMRSRGLEWLTTKYLRLLLTVLHPEGSRRMGKRAEKLVPMMLIHTRDSLTKRFSLNRNAGIPSDASAAAASYH
ncbi:YkoP family protein [Paenibacillus arenilitoris]|uniref:Polysaccharide deacetylase n=1 Tax=Paenibacillus arenilitoris TaxID=2772299 RepID=A0A927CNK8_9BACL|nr:polysaccharide deacetylase [Paenibacillus arenilitoris]MBD2869873.1 polysaccharide deacetylase [Paenibacillus arenilitoris]